MERKQIDQMNEKIIQWLKDELNPSHIRSGENQTIYFKIMNLAPEFVLFTDLRVSYLPSIQFRFDYERLAFYDTIANIIQTQIMEKFNDQFNTL